MTPFAWRRPSMNRATVMIQAPCRFEKGFGPVQPRLRQEDAAAPAQGQRAAAEVPDGEADIVAGHGRGEGDDRDQHDVEPADPA